MGFILHQTIYIYIYSCPNLNYICSDLMNVSGIEQKIIDNGYSLIVM